MRNEGEKEETQKQIAKSLEEVEESLNEEIQEYDYMCAQRPMTIQKLYVEVETRRGAGKEREGRTAAEGKGSRGGKGG